MDKNKIKQNVLQELIDETHKKCRKCAELKLHIETKFTDGMNWDNYGKWHIDHIYPLSKLNLQEKQDLAKACHYTNLQPLWAKDNLVKSDIIIDEVISVK
jgi:predicted transcriptional regulator